MKTRSAGWFRLLAVTALLATACSSPSTGHGTSASRTAPTDPSPTTSPPQQALCTPSNRCFALVTLRGSNRFVVRDVTDITHPMTVTMFDEVSSGQFVSAIELSYIDYSANSLIRMPLAGSPRTTVASSTQFMGYVAWSPDGSSVVYTTETNSPNSLMALHRVSAGLDRVLGSMPGLPGVGCEYQFCAGVETWDVRLYYSPDGTQISLIENIGVPVFRIWTSSGKLLDSGDSQSRSMSVWSGRSLYFRDPKGVEAWRDGVVSPFLPGVAWIRPKASPAGGQIVYETRDALHVARVFVVDTTTRSIRELRTARFNPVFLTSRYVWYRGQRSCVAADQCPAGWSVADSGKTYIYDLQDGSETESKITYVYDVWPHPA